MRPLTCHPCESLLVAYVHHELNLRVRRQVARHLDNCPLCYARYIQQRDLAAELAGLVPLIGRDQPARFSRVWAGIQADIAGRRRHPPRYGMGLAALLLALALLIPTTMNRSGVMLASVPTQPSPQIEEATRAPRLTEPVAAATAVAMSVTAGSSPLTPRIEQHMMPALDVTSAP